MSNQPTVYQLLQTEQSLQTILQKVAMLKALDQQLKKFLPANFQHNTQVANFREGLLIVQVDNPAVATQMRFLTSDLLARFRTEGKLPQLSAIKIIMKE